MTRTSVSPEPVYFDSPAAFRRWLIAHHDTATELIVGFHKAHTGRPTLAWSESVDEALCVGWIDGVRRPVDSERYTIRFTPRRPRSIWSRINVEKVERLRREGRILPAGERAFAMKRPDDPGYSFADRHHVAFEPADERRFRKNRKAWAFFEAQPPGYRRTAVFYVTSAKRPETREKRLLRLIEDSEAGLRIGQPRRT
ncbi:MAG: YdeI/OmpD-associated family protein [Vicinamibacterales bacterium]